VALRRNGRNRNRALFCFCQEPKKQTQPGNLGKRESGNLGRYAFGFVSTLLDWQRAQQQQQQQAIQRVEQQQ
jgi:hypothetical protein